MAKRKKVAKVASEHRIQVRVEDEKWERALQMARANGVAHVSRLCELLLEREAEKLGLGVVEATREAPEPGDGSEHRLNVRIKHSLWERSKQRTAALGLDAISDLVRILLEREVEAWEKERGRPSAGARKRKA